MREIKFRAWDEGSLLDERRPSMMKVVGMGESIEGIVCESYERTESKTRYDIPVYRISLLNPPIMQWTGLKDKNGKEIYEGDIIDGRYGKEIVKWHSYCSGFIPFCNSSNNPDAETETEVIGNIYENKELLEQANER